MCRTRVDEETGEVIVERPTVRPTERPTDRTTLALGPGEGDRDAATYYRDAAETIAPGTEAKTNTEVSAGARGSELQSSDPGAAERVATATGLNNSTTPSFKNGSSKNNSKNSKKKNKKVTTFAMVSTASLSGFGSPRSGTGTGSEVFDSFGNVKKASIPGKNLYENLA